MALRPKAARKLADAGAQETAKTRMKRGRGEREDDILCKFVGWRW